MDRQVGFVFCRRHVSLADGQVTLRGTDGVEIEVPLESLNAGDQAWIKTKLFGTSTPDPGSMTTAPFSPPESAPGGVIASFSDLSWGLSAPTGATFWRGSRIARS